MFSDFLNVCSCVLPEESDDFHALRAELSGSCFLGYAPMIALDLWPMYALHCTGAKKLLPGTTRKNVYLCPIGAHDYWARPEFTALVRDFYLHDETPEHRLVYGFEIEEMLLLRHPDAPETLSVNGVGEFSVVYLRLNRSGTEVHLFLMMEDPSACWKTVVERFRIPVNILVESNKGLGDWLTAIPLYGYLTESPYPELRPDLYFKGKYISNFAPEGFCHLYDVPESGIHECVSRIYRTSW